MKKRKNPLRDDKVENFYSSVDGHGLKRTTDASCARRLATVTVLSRLA
jgi:hypothetical protein